MIKKLNLSNFQTHKCTEIRFHPGINVFRGTSDHGKSAIIRAIRWLYENRPLGDGFVCNQIGEDEACEVQILMGSGEKIRRLKKKGQNEYFLNDKEFEVAGREVPTEIVKVLNYSDVNIQLQFDPPFLVLSPPGEVARFFNSVVKIDYIDRVLSLAASKKRKNNENLRNKTELLEELKKKEDKFNWIKKAEEIYIRTTKLTKEKDSIKSQLEKIFSGIQNIQYAVRIINQNQIKIEAEDILKSIEKRVEKFEKCKSIISSGENLVCSFNNKELIVKNRNNVNKAENLWKELKEIETTKENTESKITKIRFNFTNYEGLIRISNEYKTEKLIESEKITKNLIVFIEKKSVMIKVIGILQKFIDEFSDLSEEINISSETIEKLSKELPNICPTCGQPWPKYKGEIV